MYFSFTSFILLFLGIILLLPMIKVMYNRFKVEIISEYSASGWFLSFVFLFHFVYISLLNFIISMSYTYLKFRPSTSSFTVLSPFQDSISYSVLWSNFFFFFLCVERYKTSDCQFCTWGWWAWESKLSSTNREANWTICHRFSHWTSSSLPWRNYSSGIGTPYKYCTGLFVCLNQSMSWMIQQMFLPYFD